MPRATQSKSGPQAAITPVGLAEYVYIQSPSKGGQYDSDHGDYRFDVVTDPLDPAFIEFKEKCKQATAAIMAEQNLVEGTKVQPPWRDHLDADKKPTGLLSINCKTSAGRTREDGTVQLFPLVVRDAAMQPVDPVPAIGRGSKLRASCIFTGFYRAKDDTLFISCRPEVVQLVELVEFTGGRSIDVDNCGLGTLEGGFVAANVQKAPEPAGVDPATLQSGGMQPIEPGKAPF